MVFFFAGFYEYCITGTKLRMQCFRKKYPIVKSADVNKLYQKQNDLFYFARCLAYMRTSIIKILEPDLPERRGGSVGLCLFCGSATQTTHLTYKA